MMPPAMALPSSEAPKMPSNSSGNRVTISISIVGGVGGVGGAGGSPAAGGASLLVVIPPHPDLAARDVDRQDEIGDHGHHPLAPGPLFDDGHDVVRAVPERPGA